MDCGDELGPEDIFSGSLQSLYEYQPVTLASAGSVYTHTSKHTLENGDTNANPVKVTLMVPDTLAANWFLHASDIWASSLYLADHLDHLGLDGIHHSDIESLHVLELGAAAGLPGILLAKSYPGVFVTVSDYPDTKLIKTLSDNVTLNGVSGSCRAVPYAWGSDTQSLVGSSAGFDLIIAADTLWNPDLHVLFIDTLRMTLKKSKSAYIHLVAGLHTGRYTIQSFMDTARGAGFETVLATEYETSGTGEREWKVLRSDIQEEEKEKRKWVVWIILKWQIDELSRSQPSAEILT